MEESEKGLAVALIEEYANLQRIRAAEDREKEIQYQLKTVRTKLEALGIAAGELDIDRETEMKK